MSIWRKHERVTAPPLERLWKVQLHRIDAASKTILNSWTPKLIRGDDAARAYAMDLQSSNKWGGAEFFPAVTVYSEGGRQWMPEFATIATPPAEGRA